MNAEKERLRQFAVNEDLSNREFSEKCGLSSNFLSGENSPGTDKLVKIHLVFPKINMDFVITGRGEMEYKEPITESDITQTKDEQAGYGTAYENLRKENEELKTKYISCLEEKDSLRVSLEKIYLNEPVREPAQ